MAEEDKDKNKPGDSPAEIANKKTLANILSISETSNLKQEQELQLAKDGIVSADKAEDKKAKNNTSLLKIAQTREDLHKGAAKVGKAQIEQTEVVIGYLKLQAATALGASKAWVKDVAARLVAAKRDKLDDKEKKFDMRAFMKNGLDKTVDKVKNAAEGFWDTIKGILKTGALFLLLKFLPDFLASPLFHDILSFVSGDFEPLVKRMKDNLITSIEVVGALLLGLAAWIIGPFKLAFLAFQASWFLIKNALTLPTGKAAKAAKAAKATNALTSIGPEAMRTPGKTGKVLQIGKGAKTGKAMKIMKTMMKSFGRIIPFIVRIGAMIVPFLSGIMTFLGGIVATIFSPIGLIVAAVIAIGAALYFGYKWIKEKLQIDSFKDMFAVAVGGMQDAFAHIGNMFSKIRNWVSDKTAGLFDFFQEKLGIGGESADKIRAKAAARGPLASTDNYDKAVAQGQENTRLSRLETAKEEEAKAKSEASGGEANIVAVGPTVNNTTTNNPTTITESGAMPASKPDPFDNIWGGGNFGGAFA